MLPEPKKKEIKVLLKLQSEKFNFRVMINNHMCSQNILRGKKKKKIMVIVKFQSEKLTFRVMVNN